MAGKFVKGGGRGEREGRGNKKGVDKVVHRSWEAKIGDLRPPTASSLRSVRSSHAVGDFHRLGDHPREPCFYN